MEVAWGKINRVFLKQHFKINNVGHVRFPRRRLNYRYPMTVKRKECTSRIFAIENKQFGYIFGFTFLAVIIFGCERRKLCGHRGGLEIYVLHEV